VLYYVSEGNVPATIGADIKTYSHLAMTLVEGFFSIKICAHRFCVVSARFPVPDLSPKSSTSNDY
jgi:hypothetical protein